MIEQDYAFECPHCGDAMSTRIDASGGKHQQFIQDCETCCKPIQITVGLEADEVVSFSVEPID